MGPTTDFLAGTWSRSASAWSGARWMRLEIEAVDARPLRSWWPHRGYLCGDPCAPRAARPDWPAWRWPACPVGRQATLKASCPAARWAPGLPSPGWPGRAGAVSGRGC